MILFKRGNKWKSLMIIALMTSLLCINIPVTAKPTINNHPKIQSVNQNSDVLQQGKALYDAGKYVSAIKLLQQGVDNYHIQGDKLRQAVGLSNIALAYQKLGLWSQANQAVTESLKLLENIPQNPLVYAQTLDIQGSIQLELGQAEPALATWQRTEGIYKQINHQSGVVDSRINQAQAWQVLGFYRRSLNILTTLEQELQAQPLSITKSVELRALGDALQLAGDLKKSRQVLQQSLEIARKLDSPQDMSAAKFSLGNTARVEQDLEKAIALYHQAASVSPNPITKVFVLDEALRNVPMATLYDGQQYLVEKYAVALSLGLQLLAPKPLTQEPLKVLAAGLVQPPPEFPKFPPLPEIKSEFNLIDKAGVSTKQLLNQEFTSTTLEKNVNTTPFNVLHLATHGQFSSQPENTFILAADGAINVTQFDSLLRRRDQSRSEALEMLVLSACQTAAGDNRATLGLAGASVKAGARSTLASLWHISDKSTAILMGEFYGELANTKVTKAEALRRAQVRLLKKYPNYERPGFWAPYVLVGNWL